MENTGSTEQLSTARSANPDGRLARGEKSREKILTATFSLYEQGILVPTAQQVADESGMGIRTVFRQFSDVEALFVQGNTLLQQRYHERPVLKPEGNLEQRIQQLVNDRFNIFEDYAPYIRSTLVQIWRYETLRNNYRVLVNGLRKLMFKSIPELKDTPKHVQCAAEAALGFEAWDRYRAQNRLSKADTVKSMTVSLKALLALEN